MDFKQALDQVKNIEESVLIEVQGVTNQEYIQIARKKDSSGKLQRMPIENQFPFVDESEFQRELYLAKIAEGLWHEPDSVELCEKNRRFFTTIYCCDIYN